MESVPLFTSIPPVMNRKDYKGVDLGEVYQRKCVQSWIDCGFTVYSINSASERVPEYLDDLIVVKKLERDAFEETDKPLPYLIDMFGVISKTVSKGSFVITNADIFFTKNDVLLDSVRDLRRNECLVEQRYDVSDAFETAGASIYAYGFDLFAFNVEDISNIPCEGLVFGVPWWDHALPIKSMLSGLSRRRIHTPLAYHLKHEERWDSNLWFKFGRKFVEATISQTSMLEGGKRYKKQLEREVGKHKFISASARKSTASFFERMEILEGMKKDEALLHRLSNLNISTIDSW